VTTTVTHQYAARGPRQLRGSAGARALRRHYAAEDSTSSRSAHANCDSYGVERVAPTFAVRDLAASMAFYERLGFAVREYHGGSYGFASWHEIEIHLDVVPDDIAALAPRTLFVDDADAPTAEWTSSGVEVDPPQDTKWRQRRRCSRRPDGNVIGFCET
jgi:catechol 2,3-dioxygenase-like lactoylglutathione lyase family enzyme